MGAKRSQRRSVRYEKDQSGCMRGLISMFDFRQGRTSRKLITDKRHGSKHISGSGISKNKFEVLRSLEENCQGIIEGEESTIVTVSNTSNKPSVKKLIEEEMVNEQCSKNEGTDSVVEPKKSELTNEDRTKEDNKKAKKTRKKSRDMDNPNPGVAEKAQSECSCKQNNTDQQSAKDLGIDEIMEEFSRRIHQKGIGCMKDGPNGEATELLGSGRSDFEEKLRAAIKEFIVKKLANGKHLKEDQKTQDSNELMNELELIGSGEELILKLQQDSQSLLVKYVQNLQDSKKENDGDSVSVAGSESSEQKLVDAKSEDVANHKHRSFFRRKVKSQERNTVKEDDHHDDLNRIVILKPGPLVQSSKMDISLNPSRESHNSVANKEPSDRVGSHYFLSEIKRRLKNAMGKQNHEVSRAEASDKPSEKHRAKRDAETGVRKGNIGRNSPTKDHFYIERIAKPSCSPRRADKINQMKDPETSKHENTGLRNERISNIYLEAKKHLSELLSTGDGVDLSSRQNPKTLGRILSLPEYNTSPVGSPGRDWEKSFVTARTRFSSLDKGQNVDENESSPKGATEAENLDSQTLVSDNSSDNKVQASNPSPGVSDDIVHEIEVEEAVKCETSREDDSNHVKEENVVLDSPREPCWSSSIKDDQNGDASMISDDKDNLACLEQDSKEEKLLEASPPGTPSGSLIDDKALDLEIAAEVPERPSPVSVLEPVFAEDDISPANTTSQPNEAPGGKGFPDDKDAIFGYVKVVMLGSGLDWDEICIKLLSSDQLLDPALVDEVELFSNWLCRDEKLLFDCINEVLVELCQYCFGSSPWVSFTKPSVLPSPTMKNITLETFKGVHWHLLQLPLPRTLEQIVRKDMERNRTWLDARFDAETFGFDMGEAILEDLMEDTILSYVDDCIECEHGDALPESKESEVAAEPSITNGRFVQNRN